MPVAPNRKNPATQAIAVLIAGLIGFVALFFLITRIYSQAADGDVRLNLGDERAVLGDAEALAAKIDDDDVFGGDPILVPGLGNDRDVWVQHIGEDPLKGWLVFAARPDDAPRSCTAEWQRDTSKFVDSCDQTEYPEDGQGLRQYPVEVIDGDVVATIASPN